MTRIALPLLLLALVACADGSAPTAAPAPSQTTATPTGVPSSTAPPVATSSAAATSATPPPYAAARYFRSPSGRIGCGIESAATACDVIEKTWKPTPKPATCENDWGHGMYVPSNPPAKARFSCAGDTVYNADAPVLPYGDSVSANGFRCESRRDGMRCVHEASGHGFDVSRDRYRLY